MKKLTMFLAIIALVSLSACSNSGNNDGEKTDKNNSIVLEKSAEVVESLVVEPVVVEEVIPVEKAEIAEETEK